MKILIAGVLLVISLSALQETNAATDKVVCYFGSWATYRHGRGKFDVETIDPRLCTHLIYTFVGLNSYDGSIRLLDEWNDLEDNYGKGAIKRFNKLKERNPELKTIIAIGGWNEGSEKYSTVMANNALRARFVKDAVNITLHFGFDGFDLDWEYPNQRNGKPHDVDNYSKVLSELRVEFDKHGLLLSSAVAAAEFSAAQSYNIREMSKYLDIINVMAYDLHGTWDKQTGIHAALYPSKHDVTDQQKQLNVAACINYWINQGADPAKIVLGMPTYARTFTLDDPKQNGVGAPSMNPGNAGPYTSQPGMLGYNEILEWQAQGGWTVVWEQDQEVPYMYKGNQWVGYDNPASIRRKVQWAKEKGLGGAMIWSIETDDFQGLSGAKFSLLHAINSELGNDIPTEAPTVPPMTTTTSSGGGGNEGICQQEGYVRDAQDCAKFYFCMRDGDDFRVAEFRCAEGLYFDLKTLTCNYPWNVDC